VLAYLSSSIWASPAQILVKTDNVVERHYPSKLEYVEAGFINLLSAMNKMELLVNCVEIVDDRQ
jgi:hypothetical protein